MTNEELAQHWKTSLKEVKNISNIVNYLYSVELISPHKGIWNVVLRANDGKNNYILMEEGTAFTDKKQAIIQGTHWAQQMKMSSGQAELMGIPKDAFLSLNPINGYEKAVKAQFRSPKKLSPSITDIVNKRRFYESRYNITKSF